MGLIDNLNDLFKSEEEIRKENEKRRRKAIRDAERAIGCVKDKIADLKLERDKAWNEARAYLRDGQKAAAQRCLQTVQANENMMGKLERKCWVSNLYITKLQMAKADQDIAAAMENLSAVLNIDPDKISDVLIDVNDSLSEQSEIDKMWDKQYAAEMNGIAKVDSIPSIEDMMSNLEKEVVADVSGGKIQTSANTQSSIAEEIGTGRRKLKDLIDNKK